VATETTLKAFSAHAFVHAERNTFVVQAVKTRSIFTSVRDSLALIDILAEVVVQSMNIETTFKVVFAHAFVHSEWYTFVVQTIRTRPISAPIWDLLALIDVNARWRCVVRGTPCETMIARA
jgi:hypothetical protein